MLQRNCNVSFVLASAIWSSPLTLLQVPEPHIRTLGLAVLRGPTITVLNPVDGLEEIANPFLPPGEQWKAPEKIDGGALDTLYSFLMTHGECWERKIIVDPPPALQPHDCLMLNNNIKGWLHCKFTRGTVHMMRYASDDDARVCMWLMDYLQ